MTWHGTLRSALAGPRRPGLYPHPRRRLSGRGRCPRTGTQTAPGGVDPARLPAGAWLSGLSALPQRALGWLGEAVDTKATPAPAVATEASPGGSSETQHADGRGGGRQARRPHACHKSCSRSSSRPGNAGRCCGVDRAGWPAVRAGAAGDRLCRRRLLAAAALAGGCSGLRRLCRAAWPTPPTVSRLFRHIAGPQGEGVALLASGRTASPLMFCWWRPVIVLPAGLCQDGDTPALRLLPRSRVVPRRTPRRLDVAPGHPCELLLFSNPLFWWLRRQVRLCQDFLADARAAEQASAAKTTPNTSSMSPVAAPPSQSPSPWASATTAQISLGESSC